MLVARIAVFAAGALVAAAIGEFFRLEFDPDPAPTDPISVDQSEFYDLYERLAAARVPLKPDREQAWRDFAGWRVNYDAVLLGLCRLTTPPEAPWSSDRSSGDR